MENILEVEADDENSSFENEGNILHLMNGIAISSQRSQVKLSKTRKNQSIRHHKISKAEKNLMNNYRHLSPLSNSGACSYKLNSLEKWKVAFTKIKKIKDPWKNFDLDNILPEKVERHIFDSISGLWLQPVECHVKIESKPFNRGAMRKCFRLKKSSSLFKDDGDWYHAGNYVAKRYIAPVDDSVYFEDVKLQCDAKLWGQEYSRQTGIVKKVDICQMSIIKFVDRPEQPLYHLEHFIDGDYIKYNSNSGFVDDYSRNTPQAFSHFTFERSGHKLIVVDIQGVGDLYTDPQIHTFAKNDYGDGNLGPRGMALFFNSHICNAICNVLGLKKFDLSPAEIAMRNYGGFAKVNNLGTVALHHGIKVKSIFEENYTCDLERVLAGRLNYENINEFSDESSCSNLNSMESKRIIPEAEDGDDEGSEAIDEKNYRNRLRSWENAINEETYKQYFLNKSMEYRTSSIVNNLEVQRQIKSGECILGEIHHELARLHSCGKLVEDSNTKNIDWESFFYHEEAAAKLGYLEAICNLARFYLDMDPDSLFENYPYKPSVDDRKIGLEYMTEAATFGDRRSMIYLGDYFKKDAEILNWSEAYNWYERTVASANDKDNAGGFDSVNDIPLFEIQARMGEIKSVGGHFLDQDLTKAYELYSQAADNATIAGKGRFAAKLYALADEILSKLNR